MANLITTAITWAGKEALDYFIKPIFIGQNPLQNGIRVIPNVQSKLKLNYFAAFNKILKAYSKGFTGTNFTTHTQRDLDIVQLKAEGAQDANEFWQTVFEMALNKGVEWNDITGTLLEEIVLGLFVDAVDSDVYRLFWLANEHKEDLVSTTYGAYNGTADTDYNVFDGIWKMIFENAATSPSSSQIKRIAASDGAVAEVDTVTMTGTSGTANVTVGGIAYLATFATSLTVTCTNFVALHAAALLLRDIVLTSSTDTLIFTANIPGQPQVDPTVSAAVTGDLTGSNANTTANTAPAALAADEAVGYFRSMYEQQPGVLRQVADANKRLYVDWRVYDNYIESLEDGGVYTETAKSMLINGIERTRYRGIPIIPYNWKEYLEDFPHASGEIPAYPHRAVLSVPENLVIGIDATSEFNQMEFWYNKDEQENRFRKQLKMGVNYVHNQMMVVLY